MASGAAQLSEKELMILDCALELLKQTGDAGLTMRKLAERAGMRLSNVQYYFKSRDDVLKAMTTRYFEACAQSIRELPQDTPRLSRRQRIERLIEMGLSHGDELSDMCRIFRELWAISTRNEAVRAHMLDYYRTLSTLIADFALGERADPEARSRLASLLLPFFEGYSVTEPSVPLSTEQVSLMLTDIAVSIAEGAERGAG